ncbi:hypothetical protein SKAU_G00188440 [Synaphobranchus kaupii]|uniref:Uncharacterized protein n=1 Tax=Synaphobranchus kaupii TaxID=118154 RepID=A0A9Q1IX64_SYNKA|nr:hypothetical protein SKAU_G00188440 [Synaphobranchus kaupii]
MVKPGPEQGVKYPPVSRALHCDEDRRDGPPEHRLARTKRRASARRASAEQTVEKGVAGTTPAFIMRYRGRSGGLDCQRE